MQRARLHGCGRPRSLDRHGETGQPVTTDDQHVGDVPVRELRTDPGPERRTLGGLVQIPRTCLTIHVDGRGPAAHVRAVTDLHDDRVQPDSPGRTTPPAGPLHHDLDTDPVDVLADRLPADLSPGRGDQMMLDVADGHPVRAKEGDYVNQPTHSACALRDQGRG